MKWHGAMLGLMLVSSLCILHTPIGDSRRRAIRCRV